MARIVKTKKYLVEKFDENVHYEFVPCKILPLGLLAYFVVHRGDKVFEFNQFHLTKCANAKKLGRKVGLNMVMINGPRRIRGKKELYMNMEMQMQQ